jgi:hypothetical protein
MEPLRIAVRLILEGLAGFAACQKAVEKAIEDKASKSQFGTP